ncbi:DUF6056 family protein [Helicobacter sp.]|uniref:DUF6056 family protein n=1 Tax=Helicobacter sp. TaxID=218 RepID=UPI003751F89A|nr:DUF6056 family protein [Helicobacter sp.]
MFTPPPNSPICDIGARSGPSRIDSLGFSQASLLLFFGLYIFFFTLNAMFPVQSDDLGAPLGNLDSMIGSYVHWNGRIGELLKVWFGSCLAHTPYFPFINALFGAAFLYLFFALIFGRFPSIVLADLATIALILFVLMAFRAFGAIFFWAAGSSNYLWAYCFILIYLIPYRIFWQNPTTQVGFSISKILGMFMLGIIAGWSSELGIVLIICQIILLGYGFWRRVSLPLWYYAGILGFVVGWLILYMSPGHKARAVGFFQKSGAYVSISDFLAMSLRDKFFRWQRVFGSISLYRIQVFTLMALWWIYVTHVYQALAVRIVIIMLGFCFIILVGSVYHKIVGFLLTPFACLFSLYFVYTLYHANKRIMARYAFVIACIFAMYFMSIAVTLQVGLPPRAMLHYGLFDSSLLIFVFRIMGEMYSHKIRVLWQKIMIVVCICFGIFVLMACADMRLKWERMLASIVTQKAMGATDIIVDKQTFVSYYKGYTDWSNPGSDPTQWPNTTYARVFGVQSFIAK